MKLIFCYQKWYKTYKLILCRAILAKFGPQIARWTLFFLILSCGMYISSTAFLPSSFAMYLGMLALGAWFEGAYEVIYCKC